MDFIISKQSRDLGNFAIPRAFRTVIFITIGPADFSTLMGFLSEATLGKLSEGL
jgi:hypothetical protein